MRELEITFLGTGTSHGIPVIGCQCCVCLSSDPRDKRLRTAALLRTPENSLIQIDTPPDFRFQCLRESIERLDAVLITHPHTDHVMGFDDLRRFCEMEDKSLPILGSPHTLENLRRIFPYAFNGAQKFRTYVRPHPVPIHGPFELCGLEVTPVDLPHGQMVTTGLVFSRNGRRLLAYYTDCQEVPPAAEEAARGCEVLVLDALRHAAHTTHMSLEAALEATDRIAPRRAFFIHMCHDLGHAETEAILPETIRLAYDGLRIAI